MKKIVPLILALSFILFSCGGPDTAEPTTNLQNETVTTDMGKIQTVVLDLHEKNNDSSSPQTSGIAPERVEINIEGSPVRGDKNAPVTIIEFSDFQCPVCERFYREVSKNIKKKYVDTGKVKWVHMDYPLYNIHEYAIGSAKAAECAFKQDKFWEMHDYLFEHPYSWQTPDIKNILTNAAREIDLDQDIFSTCYDSDAVLEKIGGDFYTGQTLGVNGTPVFFINGKTASGYRTLEQMSELIEAELK